MPPPQICESFMYLGWHRRQYTSKFSYTHSENYIQNKVKTHRNNNWKASACWVLVFRCKPQRNPPPLIPSSIKSVKSWTELTIFLCIIRLIDEYFYIAFDSLVVSKTLPAFPTLTLRVVRIPSVIQMMIWLSSYFSNKAPSEYYWERIFRYYLWLWDIWTN